MTLNRARSAADRILARYGGEASLERETGPQQNPWDPPAGVVSIPVQAIETGFEQDYLVGGSVIAGDVMLLIRSDVAPAMTDRLTLRGRDYTIVALFPVQPAPAGLLIHTRLHARVG